MLLRNPIQEKQHLSGAAFLFQSSEVLISLRSNDYSLANVQEFRSSGVVSLPPRLLSPTSPASSPSSAIVPLSLWRVVAVKIQRSHFGFPKMWSGGNLFRRTL